jgi:hypothetical protein
LAFVGLALLLTAPSLPAQTAGDYRSVASGNWSSSSIWQTFDGSSWAAASSAPGTDGIANSITIQSSNLVTNDASATILAVVVSSGAQLIVPSGVVLTVNSGNNPSLDVFGKVVVDSGGQLVLSAGAYLNAEGPGINLDVYGSFANAGIYQDAGAIGSLGYSATNIVVEGGGIYHHNLDGGSVVTANWLTNSTCEIDGVVSDNVGVHNLGQPIWHFNWNCPGQKTSLFNQGTDGSLTNVQGNLNIMTAGPATAACYVRFHIAPNQVMRIGGDLSISNCQCYFGTVHTPADGTVPSLIYIGGNFIQGYYGQWRENNAHPYSNVDCILYLTDGAVHQFISSTAPYWRKSGSAYKGFTSVEQNSLVLGTNATFIMGTNIFNPWSFTNYSGSTLVLGDPNGIAIANDVGNLQPQWEGVDATWPVEGFNYFPSDATYLYSGSVAQYTGDGLPSTVANLTISNSAGVQVTDFYGNTSLVAVTNLLNIQLGTLDLQGSTPTISGLAGSGSVINGAVTMAESGLGLMPGTAGVAGILTFDSTLSFGTSTKSAFDLSGSVSAGNDQVILTGTGSVAANGATITINPLAPLAPADYMLFDVQGAGTVQSDFNHTPAWSGTPPSYAANYSVITSGKQVLLHYNSVVVLPVAVASFSIAPPSGGNCTMSYSGGAGSAFVLVASANVQAPLSSWTPVKTNTLSPGTFTIPISSAPVLFYRVRSQ